MFIILFFVVLLFEYDMKASGGIFEMVKGSGYEGTFFSQFHDLFPYIFINNYIANLDCFDNCISY